MPIYKACLLRFRPIMMTTMAVLPGAARCASARAGDGNRIGNAAATGDRYCRWFDRKPDAYAVHHSRRLSLYGSASRCFEPQPPFRNSRASLAPRPNPRRLAVREGRDPPQFLLVPSASLDILKAREQYGKAWIAFGELAFNSLLDSPLEAFFS